MRRCAADAQSSKPPEELHVAGTLLRVLRIVPIEGNQACAYIGAFPLDETIRVYGALAGSRSPWSDIIGVLPGIVLTARPDGRIDYYNRYWRTYTGTAAAASLAGLIGALAPEDAGTFSKEWKAGIESRHAFRLHARLRRADGTFRWQQFSAEPLERQGMIAKWVVVVIDVHDEVAALRSAERATQRLRFLSEAGRALHASFDPVEVARIACELVTKELGTRSVMQFHHPGGVTMAHFPRTIEPEPSMLVLLSESPEKVGAKSHANGEYVSIPITSRKVIHGAIVLDIPTALTHEDEEVLADFGERVGAALENARLYSNERRIATSLQSQLLPATLPQPYAMHVDAAYFPCEDESLVGGDWYDAFELHDGRLAVTVGDVAGHGITAAAMMGHLRHTVRAALLGGATPAGALALANDVVYGGDPELATAFVGVIDIVDMRLEWATAGHTPAILAGDGGDARFIGGSGVALGVFEQVDLETYTMKLPQRGALVLYTDGIVEFARDIIAGTERLVTVLSNLDDCTAIDARRVARDVIGKRPPIDDAALLAVSFEPVREIDMTLPATPSRSQVARRTLQRFARAWELSEGRACDLVLASCEALNNAIEHAYGGPNGTLRVQAWRSDRRLIVSISDCGSWSDRAPHEDRGRGLHIIEALADDVEILKEDSGTSVRVTFGMTEPRVPALQ